MNELKAAMRLAQSGMTAQSVRMRIAAENMANVHSTGRTPGSDPYVRKTVSFESELDDALGVDLVKIDEIGEHKAPFRLERDPGHPAADDGGWVKLPNVDPLIELADMREASRSYIANLQVLKGARESISMVLDLLRAT